MCFSIPGGRGLYTINQSLVNKSMTRHCVCGYVMVCFIVIRLNFAELYFTVDTLIMHCSR